MAYKEDWKLDDTVMPENLNEIGKGLNALVEKDKDLDTKKLDKTGGTVTGTINATNLQVGGYNVYHTNRKPTPGDIGASPVGHLHDDRYYTEAEVDTKLNTKVDKVNGKQLSTNDYTTEEKNKLAGIANSANNYTHPSTHPASIIVEDSNHRFTKDTEKANWDNKISKDDYEVGANGICKNLRYPDDIRLINKSGKYCGMNVVGNPTGTDAFYFYDVECMDKDIRIVTAKTADTPIRIFVGSYMSGWLGWKEVFNVDRKPTAADVGASPVGHLHDDRYYTEAEINSKLGTKVDVVSGKGLSTNDYTIAEKNKLAGIPANANAYTHPATHPATMITEDASNRFVTDTEKSNWNGKINKSDYEVGASGTLKDISSTDVRSVNVSGRYKGVNCINCPATGTWWYYDIEVHASTYKKITARNFNNDTTYSCTCNNGSWTSWQKVYNTTNKPTAAEIGALASNGKALDSSKLNGLTNSTATSASSIVQRDSNGDITSRLFKSEFANQATIGGAIAFRTNNSSDNYIRFCSDPKAIKRWLGLPDIITKDITGAVDEITIPIDAGVKHVESTIIIENKRNYTMVDFLVNGVKVTDWTIGATVVCSIDATLIKRDSDGKSYCVVKTAVDCGLRRDNGSASPDSSTSALTSVTAITSIGLKVQNKGYEMDGIKAVVKMYY